MTRQRDRRNALKRRIGARAFGLALAMPGLALGQQANPSATGAGGANPPSAQGPAVESIVVTARRTSESEQTVPIAITTVTAQEMQDLSMRDLIEIPKIAPGLQISSVGLGGRAKLTYADRARPTTSSPRTAPLGFTSTE